MTTSPRYFAELDGLRAVASIAVVATHTAFAAGVYTHGTWGAATQRLEVGVAIFFVLSGFLLGLPHLERAQNGRPVESTRRYAVKRLARILPVYWVVVVVALVAVPANRGSGLGVWIGNLTLVEHFRAPFLPTGLSQMWSLSVEAAFYLVLPLLGAGLAWIARHSRNRIRSVRLTLLALGLLGVVWTTVARLPELALDWPARQLPASLAWFVGGMLLASIVADGGTTRLSRVTTTLVRDRLTCYLTAGAVFVFAATPVAGSPLLVAPSAGEAVTRHLAYLVIALLLVAPSVLAPRAGSVLAHPISRHLGHTSFALFCCHLLVLEAVMAVGGFTLFAASWPLLLGLVLGVSLLVAELLHYLVERPGMRLVRRRSPASGIAAGTEADANTTTTTPSAHH